MTQHSDKFALQVMYKPHDWSRIGEYDTAAEAYRAMAAIKEYRRCLDYPDIELRVIRS